MMNRFSLSHLAAATMVVSVGLMVGAILTVTPTPSHAAKGEKGGGGGGGDDTDTNNDLVRADFRQVHADGSDTAIQSDLEGLGDQCCDPEFDPENVTYYDYWDPDDTFCTDQSGEPQIGSNIINNFGQGNWDMWIPPADLAADNANADVMTGEDGEDVVIERWTAFNFTGRLIEKNLNYGGEMVPADGCLNLDDLLYNDVKYGDPPGEGGVDFNGLLDSLACEDNLVIRLRTDFTDSLFDLPDGPVGVELRIMAPSDPPVKNGAEEGNRWWEPRFRLDHGQLQKEKDPTKPDVIVLRSIPQLCDPNDDPNAPESPKCHFADLIDLIANGPLSRRIVATYDMPVEIEIKRIIIP